MELTGKKIVVLGGAGFIGSHVVAELLRTEVGQVLVFDNFARGKTEYLEESLRDTRVSIFAVGGDIRDLDILDAALEGADGVVHLAALWLLQSRDFPRAAFAVNVEGTFNVLEASVRRGVEKIVFASSASVYGDAVEIPMTEDHPFGNRNFYGATKIAGEAMFRAFNDRFGLNYVGLRFMNVYGPNQDQTAAYTGVIPTMLNCIDAGRSPVINGDGSQAYDFIYVQDVARCCVLALQSEANDDFFNVCTGTQTSISELCSMILDLTCSPLQVIFQPYDAADSRRLVMNRVGSIEKARDQLGFVSEVGLQEGLERLIEWRNRSTRRGQEDGVGRF